MKNVAIILAVVLCVFGYSEYEKGKAKSAEGFAALNETLVSAQATIEQLGSTLKTAQDTIDELRSKVFRLETAQCPAPDVDASLSAKVDQLYAHVADLMEVEQDRRQQSVKGDSPTLAPTTPTVVMHSSPSCLPCKVWKTYNAPEWVKKGWTVRVLDEVNSPHPWPWFEVYENGKKTIVLESLTDTSYRKAQESQ